MSRVQETTSGLLLLWLGKPYQIQWSCPWSHSQTEAPNPSGIYQLRKSLIKWNSVQNTRHLLMLFSASSQLHSSTGTEARGAGCLRQHLEDVPRVLVARETAAAGAMSSQVARHPARAHTLEDVKSWSPPWGIRTNKKYKDNRCI